MKKSIISDSVKALAFDLDGTLYDEHDFILQVYLPISRIIAENVQAKSEEVYELLCQNWRTYGSSADIFGMTFARFCDVKIDEILIKRCVFWYRNAQFRLSLHPDTAAFLDSVKEYPKAIITDGNSELQRRKIESLGLKRWFREEDIFVSGDYGKSHYKPDPYMGELLKKKFETDRILYFGDRDVDRKFAENAGLDFIRVSNMILQEENGRTI